MFSLTLLIVTGCEPSHPHGSSRFKGWTDEQSKMMIVIITKKKKKRTHWMFCKVTMLPYTALYILHHPDNYLLTLNSDIKQNHEN